MSGKISLRNILSYVLASARLVHPRQIRAIIGSLRRCGTVEGLVFYRPTQNERKSMAGAQTESHAHALVAAGAIDDLTGNGRGCVTGEKDSGSAELGWIATAFQRRAFLIML